MQDSKQNESSFKFRPLFNWNAFTVNADENGFTLKYRGLLVIVVTLHHGQYRVIGPAQIRARTAANIRAAGDLIKAISTDREHDLTPRCREIDRIVEYKREDPQGNRLHELNL